jgi:hypothetical protein
LDDGLHVPKLFMLRRHRVDRPVDVVPIASSEGLCLPMCAHDASMANMEGGDLTSARFASLDTA